jgi:hypothetical protein
MRDYLLDIVQHTHGLGVFNFIKVTGTATETAVNGFDQVNKQVILNAEFKAPVAEFLGTFGMPNLDRLNTILGIPEYKEDAKITVTQQNNEPAGVHFENKTGDFKNDYRFMSTAVINDQLKNVSMKKQVKWNVDIVPTAASIQKLKFQAMVHSDATTFSTKTENGDLKIFFGDHSSHAGSFVFAPATSGSLSKQMNWPVGVVNTILSLPGDKTFKISDEGVAEITVDSGIAVWHYLLPAQTK